MVNRSLPSISIITANLNGGATLERTIKSILEQDYPALEYIVVDGGSRDGSLQILEAFRESIDILISEPDQGISDAFNKGIGRASGETIGIVSSDDALPRGVLREIGKFYREEGEPDVIYGDAFFREGKKSVRVRPDPLNRFSRHLPLKHPAVFIRRKAYECLGLYDLRYRYAMDYDLLLRFFHGGARFSYIERPLAIIASGGVNQRNLLQTIGEVREISIRHGTARPAANAFYLIKMVKMFLRRGMKQVGLNELTDWYRRASKRFPD